MYVKCVRIDLINFFPHFSILFAKYQKNYRNFIPMMKNLRDLFFLKA